MAILSTVIMVVAIIWVIAQLLTTHRRVRQGEIAVPPLFAATLVFILFILVAMDHGRLPAAPGMVVSAELCAGNRDTVFPGRSTAGHGMSGAVGRT
jgi:uncharacterized membrane protein (DUF4010 family)